MAAERPSKPGQGWIPLLASDAVGRGKIKPASIAARKCIVWRTRSGAVAVTDRFCPHMGATLAKGFVRDERLLCPFHAWEFRRDGVCAHRPDGGEIPEHVRLRSYPVVEADGRIWVQPKPAGAALNPNSQSG